jgi:hypothetical protein
MKNYIAVVKNIFGGGCGEQVRFRKFSCPEDVEAGWYYLNKIDFSSMLLLEPIPEEKWGGEWIKCKDCIKLKNCQERGVCSTDAIFLKNDVKYRECQGMEVK